MSVFPLVYVCAFCGETVGTFPNVKATAPAFPSVCDKRACREQASARYKAKP